MPINVVLIKKGGEISSAKVTDVEPNTLAKKCGFKTPNGFQKQTTWPLSKESGTVIELWAKSDGRAGSENKYDFPPPVDNALFFSTCCLVAKRVDAGTSVDVEPEEWAKLYEKLFGGFDDLTQEEEASEDELGDVDPELKTSSGYLRDGFVTDGEDSVEEGDSSEDEASAVSRSGDSEEDSDELSLASDGSSGSGNGSDELVEEGYNYE